LLYSSRETGKVGGEIVLITGPRHRKLTIRKKLRGDLGREGLLSAVFIVIRAVDVFFVTVLMYKLFKNYRNGSRTMNRIIQSITFFLQSENIPVPAYANLCGFIVFGER